MALMTKIKCPCLISWIKTRLTSISPENTVTPVRINVQSRVNHDNFDSEEESSSRPSIFCVENEYLNQYKNPHNGNKDHIDQSCLLTDLPMRSVADAWPKIIDSTSSESSSRHLRIESPREVVEDTPSITSKPSNFTHAHFDLMYYLGISAYRTRPRSQDQIDLDDSKRLLILAESRAHLVSLKKIFAESMLL